MGKQRHTSSKGVTGSCVPAEASCLPILTCFCVFLFKTVQTANLKLVFQRFWTVLWWRLPILHAHLKSHVWNLSWWWGSFNTMEVVRRLHFPGKCSHLREKEWQGELSNEGTLESCLQVIYHPCHLPSSSMLLTNSIHKHSYQSISSKTSYFLWVDDLMRYFLWM